MLNRIFFLTLLVGTAQAWQPAPESMLTEWGAGLKPEHAWREYPRPALAREEWINLNGLWKYAVTPEAAATAPADWEGDILVPFAIESALSGVKTRIKPEEAIWYQREFTLTKATGKRVLLHFEAVDYESAVWVNHTKVGENTGGYLPFSFDITDALEEGANTIIVKATDATNTPGVYQTHGKQVLAPGVIWYTPVSGIWQTVWLEQVPEKHIISARITPSISGTVAIALETRGGAGEAAVTASLGGKEVAAIAGPSRGLTLTAL